MNKFLYSLRKSNNNNAWQKIIVIKSIFYTIQIMKKLIYLFKCSIVYINVNYGIIFLEKFELGEYIMSNKIATEQYKNVKETILIMANNMGRREGIKIDAIEEFESEIIDAKVTSPNVIKISKRLLELYMNNNEKYEIVVNRILGHELAHIKHLDFNYPYKDYLRFFFCYPIKVSNCFNLLREIRADIEGKQMTNLTDEEYIKSHILDEGNGNIVEINKDDKKTYKSGYPSRFQRINYGIKHNNMSDDIIQELIEDYCQEVKISVSRTSNKIKKYFNY